jgi:surfactin synthase thioesterase subunit
MLPIVRADLALGERFVHRPQPPLSCDLSVFGGRDDPFVSHEELTAWSRHTSGTCRVRLLPGGHFFLHDQLPTLAGHISEDLLSCKRP